jgi:hypothetical protein
MVADFLEMDGWDTLYLGAGFSLPALEACLRKRRTEVLAISVTMTRHLDAAAKLVEAVRDLPSHSSRRSSSEATHFNATKRYGVRWVPTAMVRTPTKP